MDAKKDKLRKRERGEIDDEEIFLREGKSRIINFELTGMLSFAVTSNFLTPDGVISILQRYGAQYNKKYKQWNLHINDYKEVMLESRSFCKPRGIFVDAIPDCVFNLFEETVPFSDPSKENLVGYSYFYDAYSKPRLTQLPKNLQH